MPKKKIGVPTNPPQTKGSIPVVRVDSQEVSKNPLTKLEKLARRERAQSIRIAAYGGDYGNGGGGAIANADSAFYSPQLSTDFLELPQSEREKRELYRFWYNCFPSGTPVLMTDGTTRPIEDILVGDRVVNGFGEPTVVKQLFQNYVEDNIVKFSVRGIQSPIQATGNHPFLAYRSEQVCCRYTNSSGICKNGANAICRRVKCFSKDFGTPQFIHAKDLQIGDFIVSPRMIEQDSSNIDRSLMRLLGYYVSEGSPAYRSAGVHRGVEFCLNINEAETIAVEISDLCLSVFGKKARIYKNNSRNACRVVCDSMELLKFCLQHGGKGSHDKCLSEAVVAAPAELAMEFLGAYWNGDGCFTDNSYTADTMSANLGSQLFQMTRRVGFPSYHSKYYRPAKESNGRILPAGTVHYVSFPGRCYPNFSKYANFVSGAYDAQSTRVYLTQNEFGFLHRVEELHTIPHKGIVYNFEVEGEGDRKSYIAHGLATHNTHPIVGSAIDFHCFPPGAPVLMSDGTLRLIETLKIGDSVLNGLGEETRILNTFKDFVHGPIIRLTVCGVKESFDCTENHPFLIYRAEQVNCKLPLQKTGLSYFGEPQFVFATDLKEGDYACSPLIFNSSEESDVIGSWRHGSNILRRIEKVDTVHYEGPVYNIEVEGEGDRKSYIAYSLATHNTDVPMSKIRLSLPKGKDLRKNKQILHFYERMCKRVRLFQTLYDTTHEYWLMGNCVEINSLIRTPDGYSKAGDLCVGDKVLTHLGRWRPIVAVASREVDKLFNIKVWKTKRELNVTAEHPIEVFRNGGFEFVTTDQLNKDDFIRITWPSEVNDVSTVSLIENIDFIKETVDGYVIIRTGTHKRNDDAARARSRILTWLLELGEPTVRTRLSLAEEFEVSYSTFNNVVSQLDKEIGKKFHRRIPQTGFKGGSAVEWLPIRPSELGSIDLNRNGFYHLDQTYTINGPTKLAVDNDFLYLVGYWLGDGTLSRDSSRTTWGRALWQIVFGEKSNLQSEKIFSYLTRTFGSDNIYSYTDPKSLCKIIRVTSNPAFIEWWADQFGETSFGNNRKHVPNWILELPQEKLSHVVAGLIDSDGCVGQTNKGHVTFSVCSELISDFMRDACFRLGAVVNEFHVAPRNTPLPRGASCLSKTHYVIQCLDGESCSILTRNTIKKPLENQTFSSHSPFYVRHGASIALKVREILELSGSEVVNFEIEEDHTYQVNGFSTHNCYLFCEDHDLSESIPENLLLDEHEEQVGEVDYAGRPNVRVEKKKVLKPSAERTQAIHKYVQDNYQGWQRLQILPPEQVKMEVFQYTNKVKMELIPSEKDRMVVMKAQDQHDADAASIADDIPAEIRENLLNGQPIPLNTSPYDNFLCSSFCFHLAHKKAPYDERGISLLERCLRTLLYADKLRQAQTSIASRAMTPKRVVWADKMSEPDVDNLRDQVDQALIDPDFTIVTNFEVHWDEIGSRDRLLDLGSEYEITNKFLYIGLRVTEAMLTGESTYSGERIHLDVMNTMYLLYRETISEFVEQQLFAPVAEKKGFFEEDEWGNRVLLYPKLQFTRLALRDNTELQDFMFNLYQKGSLPISFILELINIDSDDALEQLKRDMMTPNDSTFNELLRTVQNKAGEEIVSGGSTNVLEKLAKALGLDYKPKDGDRFGKDE